MKNNDTIFVQFSFFTRSFMKKILTLLTILAVTIGSTSFAFAETPEKSLRDLKRAERMHLIQTIIDAKKGCTAELGESAERAEIKKCIKGEIKVFVKESVKVKREKRVACYQELGDAVSQQDVAKCTLTKVKQHRADKKAEQMTKKREKHAEKHDEFIACIEESGAHFYGTEWCPHCKKQKEIIGFEKPSFYTDCDADKSTCDAAGVVAYPTWVLEDGTTLLGTQSREQLEEATGCMRPKHRRHDDTVNKDQGVKDAGAPDASGNDYNNYGEI